MRCRRQLSLALSSFRSELLVRRLGIMSLRPKWKFCQSTGTNHSATSFEIPWRFCATHPSANVGGLRRSLIQISGLVELCDVGHPQKGIPVAGINRDSKHGRQEVARTFPHHRFFLTGFFRRVWFVLVQKKVHELPRSSFGCFSNPVASLG